MYFTFKTSHRYVILRNMISVAVVGVGHWGPNLVRNFHNWQTSFVSWVVDLNEKRLAQISQRFPDLKVTSNVANVFKDPTVDAVVIATPTSSHYSLTKAALESGKHVLVEKPITTRSDQGAELTDRALQAGRVLMVGHVFVHNAAVNRIKKYIDDGDLGQIYYISMVRTNLGPIRTDVSAAWDLASHDISVANHWLNQEPITASAVGGTWINRGIEDAVFVTLRYASNVTVNLHVSWLNPRKCRDVTVVADRKMLSFDDLNILEPVRIYDKQVTDELTRPGIIDNVAAYRSSVREGDIVIPRIPAGEPLKAECDHFVDCIARGELQPKTSGTGATSVVRVLEAIERSVKNGGREENVS